MPILVHPIKKVNIAFNCIYFFYFNIYIKFKEKNSPVIGIIEIVNSRGITGMVNNF